MVNCINCSKEVSTSFCGNCGQPNPPKRLNFGNMWFDFQSRIYGFDGMFPRTLRDLTIKPGVVAREYIQGNRVKYYGPVGYFFLMVTVLLLIMSIAGIDFLDFFKASSGDALVGRPKDDAVFELQQRIANFVNDNIRVFSFVVIIPIILMTQLFFRKAGYNFLEHAAITFYVFGHVYWFTIINLFLFKFDGSSTRMAIQYIVSIIFFAFACSDFYTYNSRVAAFIKGLMVFFLGYIIFAIVVMTFGYIYVLSDPEMQELMNSKKP